jgi:hypothetical protein
MKIQIQKASYTEGSINDYHLVQNHLKDPNAGIDQLIHYAEKRYLMTLLVSGAKSGIQTSPGYTYNGNDVVKTYIPEIPYAEMVDGNAWKYRCAGRIQKECVVVGSAAIGTPTLGNSKMGSFFKLELKDNYLTSGMNAIFPNGKYARVMGVPTRSSSGNYLYSFQAYAGDSFVFSEWFAGQTGTYTVFGGFTTYGERSKRGYANFHYPEMYINHTTKQRKSFDLSGDVNAQKVIWYELDGQKGFSFEAEAQARAQFLMEDEMQKWDGISTMRDEYGNLLAQPTMFDLDGQPIVAGDGLIQQIRGANDANTSGVGGEATYDDFYDMVETLKQRKENVDGDTWICVTGSPGMANIRKIAKQEAQEYNFTQMVTSNSKVGGDDIPVGFNFSRLNIAGEQLIFVENPQWNDMKKYPAKMSNGKSRKASEYLFLDFSGDAMGQKNIEIRARGREGINRNMVYAWFEGMTGGSNKPDFSTDAIEYHMLKENMLVVYNSKTCGILEPPVNA